MDKFITQFKEKARAKNVTSSDMVALFLYKAIKAKPENKKEIFEYFISRGFSPRKSGFNVCPWDGLRYAAAYAIKETYYLNQVTNKYAIKRYLMGIDVSELFSPEEVALADKLVNVALWYNGEVK